MAAELAAVLGLAAGPTASMVTRWPQAFPQYRVGHLMRVSGIEAAVKRLPAVAVAGAPYRGVGIPACIGSGREAARSVLGALDGQPTGAVKPRRGGVAGPSLAAGALLALSVPPFGVWPLAFVGAALLYWRLRGLRLRARLLAGWLAGSAVRDRAVLGGRLQLVRGAGPRRPRVVGPDAGRGGHHPPAGRALSFTGAATLAEAVRASWPFGGLPVGGVFLGQAGGPLLGAARLGGPLLLTAMVWGGGAGLAELARAAAQWRRAPRHRPALAAPLGIGLVVALGIAGALVPYGGAPTGTIAVAAVQGGGTRGFTAIETGRSGDFAAELAASAHLVGAAHQSLVVWPEDVVALTGPLAGSPEAARSRRWPGPCTPRSWPG